MVAIFTGLGAGFQRGSGAALGSAGLLGSATLGRGKEGVFLNAATGNLLLTHDDEFLVGKGPDVAISRTYNSQGALDDNGDHWRQSTDRRVFGLTGTVNTAGSTVKRVSADGSEITYVWDGSAYVSANAPGVPDKLTYASSVWTWRSGGGDIVETYSAYGTDNWRITQLRDADTNTLTFGYTLDKLTTITTADGGVTTYTWSGSNISSISTTSSSVSRTRTRYLYDSSDRLIEVRIDLSPEDGSEAATSSGSPDDGKVYWTKYGYDGTSKRIAWIEELDGSRLDISYDTAGRVVGYVQQSGTPAIPGSPGVAAVVDTRTTTIAYTTGQTTITDPRGQVTTLTYNSAGQLTSITAPPAETGATPQTVTFAYESVGAVEPGSDIKTLWNTTSLDWSYSTGDVDGRKAAIAYKATSNLVGDWNDPGAIQLAEGDRPDGSYSVTEGETIAYRLSAHTMGSAGAIIANIIFRDASGADIAWDGWYWSWVSGWTDVTGSAVAPTGAASAIIRVSVTAWGAPSTDPMGIAIEKGQVYRLPTGVSTIPNFPATVSTNLAIPSTNPVDDVTGYWLNSGAAWTIASGTSGGQTAVIATKTTVTPPGDLNEPGSIRLGGGDRVDGSYSVSPGETFAYRFQGNLVGAGDMIVSYVTFIDAMGAEMWVDGWYWNWTSGWTDVSGSTVIPTGAVAAFVQVAPKGWQTPAGQTLGIAIRDVQMHKVAAGASAPSWADANLRAPGRLKTVTNGAGAVTHYDYDEYGNVTQITDANGNTVGRVYDANNNLIRETVKGSTASSAATELVTRYVYDAENHLRYMISAAGQTTEYRYTTDGELASTHQYANLISPPGNTVPTVAQADALRDSLTDRSTVMVTENVYDARGNLTEIRRYGAASTSGVASTAEGYSQQNFTYDRYGQLLSRFTTGQGTESFVYDGMGRLRLSTDLNGGNTTILFNDALIRTTVTTAQGYTVVSAYNQAGDLLTTSDSGSYTNGGTATNYYDKNGQLRQTNAGGFNTYFLYDKAGRKTAQIGHWGETVEYKYDQAGRVVATVKYYNTMSSGNVTTLGTPTSEVTINSIRPTASSGDLWQWSVYDAAGNVVQTITGDGSVTTYAYDNANRLVSTVGYFNRLSSTIVDGFKITAPTTVTLPTANAKDIVLRTFFDGDGRVIGSLNAEGNLTRVFYDGAGQKIREIAYANATSPSLRASGTLDQLVTSIAADPADDVVNRWVYDGQGLLRYTIDAMNRVTELVYHDGVLSSAVGLVRKTVAYAAPLGALSSYTHAAVKSAVSSLASGTNDRVAYSVYDSAARLAYSVDALGGLTGYAYDNEGRVTKVTQFANPVTMSTMGNDTQWKTNIDAWVPTYGGTTRVTRSYYSARGEARFVIDAEGYVTQNDYDNMGRVHVTRRYANTVPASDTWTIGTVDGYSKGTSVANTFWYDNFGRLSNTFDANGVETYYGYYANGLKSIVNTASGSGKEGITQWFYDQAGRATHQVSYIDTLWSGGADTYWTYDGLGNVTTVTDPAGATTSYTYDKVGRVLTQTDALGGVTRIAYDAFGRGVKTTDAAGASSFALFDRLGRVVQSVDAAGYVTRTSYTAFGEVASVTRFMTKEASEYLSTWLAGGTGLVTSREVVDGELVVAARNSVGAVPGWAPDPWGGILDTRDGNRTDGLVAVSPGDTVSVSMRIKPLVAGVSVRYQMLYLLSDNSTAWGMWGYADSSNWTSLSQSETAPANAVGAFVSIASYRTDANVSGGFDFALADFAIKRNGTTGNTGPWDVASHALDATTTFTYDKLGRLTKSTDALGGEELFTFDAFGQTTTTTNKAGGVTTFGYDKLGQVVSQTIAIVESISGRSTTSNITTSFAYDSRGNRTQMIEAVGRGEQRTTTYTYDAANQLTSKAGDAVSVYDNADDGTSSSVNPTELFYYDVRGNLIESRNAMGARTLYWYDRLGRVTHTLSPLGTLTRTFYNARGDVTETRTYETLEALPTPWTATPPTGTGAYRVTQFTVDALGRVVTAKTPDIRTAQYTSGLNFIEVGDPGDDLITSYTYDARGNVVETINANGGVTYAWYDKLNRKTTEIDAGNYRTDWAYDAMGNVTSERRYATAASGPYNTASSPPSTSTHADDRVTTFEYDKQGQRLKEVRTGVQVFDGTSAHTTVNSEIIYTYTALGQVATKTEASGEAVTYAYDNSGRLIREQRAGFTDHLSNAVTPTVDYFYDGLGNTVSNVAAGATGSAERVTTYTYGPGGRLATMTDAEGFTRYYFYNAAGQVLREAYDAADGNSWSAAATDYDLEGRIIQQGMMSVVSSPSRTGLDVINTEYNAFGEISRRGTNGVYSEEFAYDGAGRVVKSTAGDGLVRVYLYDKMGNQTVTLATEGTNFYGLTVNNILDLWGSTRADIATAFVDGAIATITKYDARNQAIEVREPERELNAASARVTLVTSRTYTAFGEIASETNAGGYTIDYTYNTMGRQIRIESPSVSITSDSGSVSTVRPTEHRYYDRSGRLVASRDANGNLTRMELLAGTGYGGSEALVKTTITADSASTSNLYDIFGDVRVIADQLGRTVGQTFDKMGRVVQLNHAGGLIENFVYDKLGRVNIRYNNAFGQSTPTNGIDNPELYSYDRQGRLIQSVATGGDVTTYAYSWNSAAATLGLGYFGVWTKTTTYANGRTLVEQTDQFDRDVYKIDLGGHVTDFIYDSAGRLIQRIGGGNAATAVNMTYFNTGKLYEQITFTGSYASDNWNRYGSTYGYDAVGNLTSERLGRSYEYREFFEPYYSEPTYQYNVFGTATSTHSYYIEPQHYGSEDNYSDSTATYDALGRLVTWNALVRQRTDVPDQHPVSMTYSYDANGNIRRVQSSFYGIHASTNFDDGNLTTRDEWYRFDSLNRVVIDKGSLVSGVIVRGNSGTETWYDAAGQRVTTFAVFADTFGNNTRREDFVYDGAGRLIEVKANQGTSSNPYGNPAAGVTRALYTYDVAGRLTNQTDYDTNGTTILYQRSGITYNVKNQLVADTTYIRQANNDIVTNAATYSYGGGSSYTLGQVASQTSTIHRNSTLEQTSTTVSDFIWADSALQTKATTTASTNSTVFVYFAKMFRPTTQTSSNTFVTDYYWQEFGGQFQMIGLTGVGIVNDLNGQAFVRRTGANFSHNSVFAPPVNFTPADVWFRFGGKEMGHITNNGTIETGYVDSIKNRRANPGSGPFRNGATSATKYSEVDPSLEKVNSYTQDTYSTYSARSGDTLQSVAMSLWGDASLWYKLAQSNGLSGQTMLGEGQALRIPVGVVSSHHNADTVKPYDPSEITGDAFRPQPKPKKKKCGGLGDILKVVLGVVAAVATGLWVTQLAQALGPVLAGALGGAAGSVAGQTTNIMTGIQSKFSWNQVASGAIGGAIGGGINDLPYMENVPYFSQAGSAGVRAAFSSIASQGVSVAMGWQKKFSWAGVAAAGMGSFASAKVLQGLALKPGDYGTIDKTLGQVAANSASAIANSATRSLIDGSDFGDNILASLPDIIGSSIANKMAYEATQTRRMSEFEAQLEMSDMSPEDAAKMRREVDLALRSGNMEPLEDSLSHWNPASGTKGERVLKAFAQYYHEKYSDKPGEDYSDLLGPAGNENNSKERIGARKEMAYIAQWIEALEGLQGEYTKSDDYKQLMLEVTGLAISSDVYFDRSIQELLPKNIRRLREAEMTALGISSDTIGKMNDNEGSGYFGALYIDERDPGKISYIYGSRGTEILGKDKGLKDWRANIEQGLGLPSKQYELGIEIGQKLYSVLADKGLWFTGHSLGGGIAAAQSMATGANARTYNAVGVHPSTVPRMLGAGQTAYDAVERVDAFWVGGDPLNTISDMLPFMSDANGVRRFLNPSYHVAPGSSRAPTVMSPRAAAADMNNQHSRAQLFNGIIGRHTGLWGR